MTRACLRPGTGRASDARSVRPRVSTPTKANLAEYKVKRREYMRQYRARKKLEAESQKPPKEEDASTEFS
jgi:hypothetical protein